jgi:hypothetical protein
VILASVSYDEDKMAGSSRPSTFSNVLWHNPSAISIR